MADLKKGYGSQARPKRYHHQIKQGIGWKNTTVIAKTRTEADARMKGTTHRYVKTEKLS